MRDDRIVQFALALAPEMATCIGAVIKTMTRLPPDRRAAIFDAAYGEWLEPTRGTFERLQQQFFAPYCPWSEEAFFESRHLLLSALTFALVDPWIWDRRRSVKSITTRIRSTMLFSITTYAKHTMDRESLPPLDLGPFTLEAK